MNFIYILPLSVFILAANFQYTEAFAECPNSGLADPNISGVTDCVSWAAYLQSTNAINGWCSSAGVATKCCWTCGIYANFTACVNQASDISCNSAQASGSCNVVLDSRYTVSYYCQKACGVCSGSAGPQCSSLSANVCGNGKCTSVTYSGIQTSTCTCNSGYVGASCSRTNICLGSSNPCQNGATCVVSQDADVQYTCTCPAGCTGRNCTQCGCLAGGSYACQNSGQCLSSGTCVCPIGYTGATCATYLGCNAGGSLACLNSGLCLTSGTCQCTSGWSGARCENGLGCNAGGSSACKNSGTCLVSSGLCQCSSGYTGSSCQTGLGCNAGGSSACINGGVCVQNTGACQCPVGYSGSSCQVGTACSSNPCQNGATCTVNGTNAVCACTTGYYGYFCSSTSACAAPSPCQNNGVCSTQLTSPYYSCSCGANFFGLNCQVRLTTQTCSAADSSSTLCSLWKSLGFCSYTYYYQSIPVPIFCPRTCSLCSSINICQDLESSCAQWAKQGLCGTLANAGLTKYCRQSCNACPPASKRKRSDQIINIDLF